MKSSNKVLTVAVILLLLVNIALVVFLLTGRGKTDNRRNGRNGPFDMMMKELGMTEQQQKQFGEMREEHFKRIRPVFDSVRAAKAAFYGLVKDPQVNDSLLNVYGQRISAFQSSADKLTFTHFQQVRNLFEGEQQKKYDDFLQKMMQRSGNRRKDSTNENR